MSTGRLPAGGLSHVARHQIHEADLMARGDKCPRVLAGPTADIQHPDRRRR